MKSKTLFRDQVDALYAKNDWKQLEKLWIVGVGGAQTQVLADVANEYCRPDRSLEPTPNFKESSLPRPFKMGDTAKAVWFALVKLSFGSLGIDFRRLPSYVKYALSHTKSSKRRCFKCRARHDFLECVQALFFGFTPRRYGDFLMIMV